MDYKYEVLSVTTTIGNFGLLEAAWDDIEEKETFQIYKVVAMECVKISEPNRECSIEYGPVVYDPDLGSFVGMVSEPQNLQACNTAHKMVNLDEDFEQAKTQLAILAKLRWESIKKYDEKKKAEQAAR